MRVVRGFGFRKCRSSIAKRLTSDGESFVVHAAAFSYRPVPKGKIELKESVRGLFEGQTLEGILHLLHDHREGGPGRQSELLRGACWIAPIGTIRRAGANEARG